MKKSSDQMNEAVKKRTEKKRAEKKESEEKAEKLHEKKLKEEKLKEKRAERAEDPEKSGPLKKKDDPYVWDEEEDYDIISASSAEELIRKVDEYNFARRSDNVLTEQEKLIGSHIDFRG